MRQLTLGVRLRAEANFNSFVTGPNAELLTALRAAEPEPIWLWGAAGTGKTHLLQAVCAACDSVAAYFPLDRRGALPPEALVGFESCRVLCIDDVDAVAGDPVWEEALFRVFNEAAEMRTRLVFAAAAAPRAAAFRLADWCSRAAACVVYQLRELDDAGMAEALQRRAAQRGLELTADIAAYLLHRLPRDLATLLDILDHLDEASLAAQRRLSIPFIRAALEKREGTKPASRTS